MSWSRPSIRGALALTVAALALTALVAGGSLASDGKHGKEIRFSVVAQDSEAVIEPAEFWSSPTLGDSGIEDAPVYRDGEAVGSAQTVLTVTRVADGDLIGIIECSVELPEGNVFFDGSVHLADIATGAPVPVVGGTGDYAGMIGVVTMTASADGSATTLDFELTRATGKG